MKFAAQILPLIAMAICLVAYQFKRKYHILILSAFANALNALAYFLLGNAGSAMMIALASTLQCGFEAYKSYIGIKTSTPQKILYFFLFFALGYIEFKAPVDILPIAAAMMFVWSNFCQSEQKMRLCLKQLRQYPNTFFSLIFPPLFC